MWTSWIDGWKRVAGAPVLVLGIVTATMFLALPLAVAVGLAIDLAIGGEPGWATALAPTLHAGSTDPPADAIDLTATFSTAAGLLSRAGRDPVVIATVAGYVWLWSFLSGGVIDRLARRRVLRSAAFFAACGGHVWRMTRMCLTAALAAGVLLAWGYPRIAGPTGDVATLVGLLIGWVVVDFGCIRLVVEDRQSALGSLVAGARFVWRRPLGVALLTSLNVLAAWAVIAAWLGLTSPGQPGTWAACGIAVAALTARVIVRLAWVASEIAYFQRELAHAGYTAAPWPVWPDSPSVEAIEHFVREHRRRTSE